MKNPILLIIPNPQHCVPLSYNNSRLSAYTTWTLWSINTPPDTRTHCGERESKREREGERAHQCQGWKGCGMNESRESKRDYMSDHVSSSIYWTQPLWRWGPLIKSGIVQWLKERVGSTPWLICPPALFYSIFPRLYVFDILLHSVTLSWMDNFKDF